MIKEFEFYHGSVITRLVHMSGMPVKIKCFDAGDNASYVVNDAFGLYIKFSSKRMSPWRFSFQDDHQNKIQEMKNLLGEVFTVFVCNDDGLACLNYAELKTILDENHEDVEWVCVSRKRNQMYEVSGSDGKLKFKIGKKDFPSKLFSNGPSIQDTISEYHTQRAEPTSSSDTQ